MIPAEANIISFHVLYKVKHNGDKYLKMKDRTSSHGNKNTYITKRNSTAQCALQLASEFYSTLQRSYCSLCLRSISQAPFLQKGPAQRDFYVRPPKESTDTCRFLWLLLSAAYGLINEIKNGISAGQAATVARPKTGDSSTATVLLAHQRQSRRNHWKNCWRHFADWKRPPSLMTWSCTSKTSINSEQ